MEIAGTGAMWAVVLVLAASVLAGLGGYAWRRRTVPGASSFGLLMFAVAGYSLTYALELLGRDLPTKMLWIRVEYPFIVATPVLWLVFTLQYAGKGQWLSRRNTIFLSVVPLVTILAVWTNEVHHLYYSFTGIQEVGSWTLLHVEYAPWFWVHITFSYLCLLAGTLLVADAFFRATPLYRGQATVLLLGALFPWLGNFLYLTRATPWPDLDLTPLAFTLSGLILAYGLFRYRLLQVVPVARRIVVEGMPAAMIVLDAEGRIADLNPAARRLFGLTDQEIIGEPADQVLGPPEIVADILGATPPRTWGSCGARDGDQNPPSAAERDSVWVDREVEWGNRGVYRVTISPLERGLAGRRGAPRLILISDITEQTEAREALALANRRLLALQESTAALTALLDPATLFDRVIEQLECLLPCHRAILSLYDEATDKLTYVAGRGVDPHHLGSGTLQELAEAQDIAFQWHLGWVMRHKAPLLVTDSESDPRVQYLGAPRSRSMIIVPVLYQERCLGILGLASPEPSAYTQADQDLLLAFANQVAVALENARLYDEVRAWATTLEQRVEMRTQELQEAQARLLQAEKLAALGQISANLAHEIGHPLGLIHGYVELLAQEQPDHPYLSPIRDSIQQLMRLLFQLRDFSRPATGKWSPVLINEIVGRVLGLASKELVLSQIEVHQQMATSLPPIRADARQLEQVFLNLVLNARDAMPEGGELWVRTFQTGDQIAVEFADRGMGIPPENLKRIFEPYFTTKEGSGTGLGLAICQSILEAHAGRIEVSSEPGEGATFRVYLPVEQAPSYSDEVS